MNRSILWSVLAVVLVWSPSGAAGEFALPSGGCVVFLGDALLEQGMVPELVESFVRVAYPENKSRFYRMTRAEESPASLLKLYERDTESLQPAPTHVVVCLGYYGASRMTLSEEEKAGFQAGLETLVDGLLARKVSVILVTPPSVDTGRNPRLKQADYNATIIAPIAEIVRGTASSKKTVLIDWFTVSEEQRARRQEEDPSFSFTRGGLRPQGEGNALVAALLLEHWKAEPRRGRITLDWETAQVTSDLGKVTAEKSSSPDDAIKLVFEDFPMPWVLPTSRNEQITADWYACRLCSFDLTVTGLPTSGVLVETARRPFPLVREQLEGGYNLAACRTFVDAPDVARLMRLIATKNRLFARRQIDQVARKPAEPELQEAFKTLMKAYDLYHTGYLQLLDHSPRRMNLEFTIKAIRQAGGTQGEKPGAPGEGPGPEISSPASAPAKD